MKARRKIERAFHVSFKLPEQAAELLDDYRDEILREAVATLRIKLHGQELALSGTYFYVDDVDDAIDSIDPDKRNDG